MLRKSKKMMAVLLSAFLLLASVVNVFAAQEMQKLEAKLGSDNKVTVTGAHPLGENMKVSLSVTDPYGDVFYRRELTAGADGAFTAVFLMDDVGETEDAVDKSGTYRICAGGAGLTAGYTEFHFINHITGKAIVETANGAVTSAQVKEKLFTDGSPNTYADQLCLDYKSGSTFDKISDKDAVYGGMAGISGKNRYASAAEIVNAFQVAVAVQTLNETSKADARNAVEQYAEILELSVGNGSNYSKLTKEGSKSAVCEKMTGGNLDTKNADRAAVIVFEKAVYTELINEVENANLDKLTDYIEECNQAGYTDISLTDYNSSKLTDLDRANILKNVVAKQPFAELSAVKTVFEKMAADKLAEAEKDSKDSSKSGGGSGGKTSTVKVGNNDAVLDNDRDTKTENNTSTVFSDLESVGWAVEAIDSLAKRGIISGVGENRFMPSGSVKREEFVKILILALNVSAEETEKNFEDVDSNAWYYEYVMKAYAANIVKGVNFDVFGVGQPITREQMCTFLFRAMNLLDIHIEDNEKKFEFTDKAMISDYAAEAVECLYRAGIVNGVSETEFNPKGEATRAMAAQVIYQLMRKGNVA